MRIEEYKTGIALIKEKGDKRIAKETTVVYHIRKLLREKYGNEWIRCYPNKLGLTNCKLGVRNKNKIYWHERYQIELAHIAFNNDGYVFFLLNE